METVASHLALGVSLGFAAGVSPGPLLALTIASALERGLGAGLRVAVAPLLTDAPIIALAVLVAGSLPPALLRALGLAGGLFVVYLGIDSIRRARGARLAAAAREPARRDLVRGAMVNLLSPHPWLFWVTVGGPLVVTGWQRGAWPAAAFLAGFFALLVGCKAAAAWLAVRGRRHLRGDWYGRVLALTGAVLVALGLLLAWRALAPAAG